MRYSRLITCVAALLLAGPASAAKRTFVAGTGNDANPCTLAAPCRSFTAAMAFTDPNGEIVVLSSAGYGIVKIAQAVSIIAPSGVYAGISVMAGQDGVQVSAGATDKVVLSGLTINGLAGSQHGVRITSAGDVLLKACVIQGNGGDGIRVEGGGTFEVDHSELRSNGGDGIRIEGGSTAEVNHSELRSNGGAGLNVAAGTADVYVEETSIVDNKANGIVLAAGTLSLNRTTGQNNMGHGLLVSPASTAPVRASTSDSVFSGNTGAGVLVISDVGETASAACKGTHVWRNGAQGFGATGGAGAGKATLTVSGSNSSENASFGVFASGIGTTVSVDSTGITRNGSSGLEQANSAVLRSFGNNPAADNVGGDTHGMITPGNFI